MVSRRWLVLLLCLSLCGCNWTTRRGARHTLMGVNQEQALIAAHRVLTERSFDVQSVNHRDGTLVTAWRDRPQRSLRYHVTVTADSQGQGPGNVPAVTMEIRAEARDRAVHGWTAEYDVPNDAEWMFRRVSRAVREVPASATAAASAPEPEPSPPEPERPPERQCTQSRDCPPGQHCGTGRCVWECATDDECEGTAVCDRRGRCVPAPPPPPPPEPDPAAAGEEVSS